MPQHDEDLKSSKRFRFTPEHEAGYEGLNKNHLDAASVKAHLIFDEFLSECEQDDIDAPTVAYVLWIQLTHFLVFCGAPPARLVGDCVWHAEEETVAGHA
jgi:hypothetical protein